MTDANLKIRVDSTEVLKGSTQLQRLAATGKQAEKSTNSLTASNKNLAASAVKVAGAYGLFRVVSSSISAVVKSTKDFNESVSQLSSITGATGQDLQFLIDQSKEIGRTTTLSASQATTAFKLIASAKPDLLESGAALNAVTREAVTLAEAASIDLPAAANALGNSLNQFSAGADQASRFINVLAAGSKFGASAITDTSEALKNVGATAAATGLTFEQTNTAIQALAAGGIKAGEAGTGLRAVLLKLESNVDKNVRPSVVGLGQAFQNLQEKNLTVTESTALFGRTAVAAGLTLVNQASNLDTLTEKLTDTATATEQARVNVDNLAGDLKAQASAAEGLALALGEGLDPVLRDLTQSSTDFINSITSWTEEGGLEDALFVAEALAAALTLRLAPSIVITTGAAFAGTARVIALSAAIAGTGIAARIAAVATTAFGLSTAAVAGPLGAVATSMAALVVVVGSLAWAYRDLQNVQEAALSGAVAQSVAEGLEVVNLHIIGQATNITKLKNEYAELEQASFLNINAQIRQAEITGILNDEEEILNQLMAAKRKLLLEDAQAQKESSDATDFSAGAIEDLNDVLERLKFTLADGTKQTEEMTESAEEFISSLEDEATAARLTGLELALFNATAGIMNEVSGEQLVRIVELTTEIYNLGEAARQAVDDERALAAAGREAAKTDRDRARESARAAKLIQEDLRDTRDAFADFFVDLESNGGNAFDNLAKSFEASLKRMAAQWLASGIMDLFGFNGGSAGSLPSIFGGGNSGSSPASLLSTGSTVTSLFNSSGGLNMSTLFGFGGGQAANLTSAAAGVGNNMISPELARNALGNSAQGFGGGISPTSFGSNAAVNAGAGLVAGYAGSKFGDAAGQALFDKQAESGIAATVGGIAGSFFGPVGTFIGSTIGSMVDVATGGDGFKREIAGFVAAQTTGTQGQTFAVDKFASGFQPYGIGDQNASTRIIEQYRFIDQTIVDAAVAAGARVAPVGTLGGFGVDGFGDGTLFGGSQKLTEEQVLKQQNSFASQIAKHIEGLTPETTARLMGATSAQEIVDILGEVKTANDLSVESQDELNATTIGLIDSNGNMTAAMISLQAAMQVRERQSSALGAVAPQLAAVLATVDNSNAANLDRYRDRKLAADAGAAMVSLGLGNVSFGPSTGIDYNTALELKEISDSGDITRANEFAAANPLVAESVGYTPTLPQASNTQEFRYEPLANPVPAKNKTQEAITGEDTKVILSIMEAQQADMTKIIRTWEAIGMPATRA